MKETETGVDYHSRRNFGDLVMFGQVEVLLKSEKFPHSRQWKYRYKSSELSIYSCKFKLQYCATNVEESQHGYLTSEAQDPQGIYEKTNPNLENYHRRYERNNFGKIFLLRSKVIMAATVSYPCRM